MRKKGDKERLVRGGGSSEKIKIRLWGFAIETSTPEGRAGRPGQSDRGRQPIASRWGEGGGTCG